MYYFYESFDPHLTLKELDYFWRYFFRCRLEYTSPLSHLRDGDCSLCSVSTDENDEDK